MCGPRESLTKVRLASVWSNRDHLTEPNKKNNKINITLTHEMRRLSVAFLPHTKPDKLISGMFPPIT